MWRHDPEHSATGQSGPTNLTLRWKFTAGGAVVSSPSVSDGIAYFGSQDKNVYAVDAWTGALIWKFNTSARIASSPAVVNGKVYVGPDDGYVYCLDAYNGSLIWSRFAGGYVPAYFAAAVNLRSSPTVIGGKVYVGSLDKNLYSLDANNGEIAWKYQTDGYITSSPAVVDGVVYIISQEPASAGLYMLNAANGNLIRRISLPYVLATRGTDMHSSPAVASGMIFAASNKRMYYGINATTGNVAWTFKDDDAEEFIIASPINNNGRVFLVDQFFIVAVDAFTGRVLWQTFVGTEFYVSPTYAEGKLYVTSDQRGIYVLNATDGAKLSFFSTGSNSWSSATLYEGKIYVGNNDWNVYCLAEAPLLNASVTVEVTKREVVLGERLTVSGRLVPEISDARIFLGFVKPDDTADQVPVETDSKGAFNFTYTPNVVGNWTVAAWWQSDRGYYSSAYSDHVSVEVQSSSPSTDGNGGGNTGVPMEYIYAAIVVIVIVVANVVAYAVMKRRAKKQET
jgi:outer membrane protein assembly factor BamB